jgi:hypothetical protein
MQKRVDRIAPMDAVFPDAEVDTKVAEPDTLEPVSPTDRPRRRHRHCNTRAAIIAFNVPDFAATHLNLPIEVIHADDLIMDVVDLNEKRAVAAFRELRARQEESSVGGG